MHREKFEARRPSEEARREERKAAGALCQILCAFFVLLCACARLFVAGPKDFSQLDAALLAGEEGRETALSLAKGRAAFDHLVSLLEGVLVPGEDSARAWGAYHVLVLSGEEGLAALRRAPRTGPIQKLALLRASRRLGLAEEPSSAFAADLCAASRVAPSGLLLRYEAGLETVEGRLSLEIDGEGRARLVVGKIAQAPQVHLAQISAIELGFLLEKACRSAFWELTPLRSLGGEGEDQVKLVIELPSAEGVLQEEISLWGAEWRQGPTSSLARLLDATAARCQKGGLLRL